jgi:hypothetical protein
MEEPDRAIIEYKYKGLQFGKMNPSDQKKWAAALLLKINVITGWVLAEDQMDVLADQFEKKLIENYGDMNPEEIEFAFRRDGTIVKDWGKPMNLALIDEVLIPYRNTRHRLSLEMEERSKEPPAPKIYTETENLEYSRQQTEEAFQRILRGNLNFIPKPLMKEILTLDGLMKKEETLDGFLVRWINSGKRNIYVQKS